MDLLERYLQAVGQYLAAETKDDVLAELRTNLEAEIDERASEKTEPLAESEIAAILKAHGRPMIVAARYAPQRYLIGPEVFPFYQRTLRKAAPFVVLIYLVAHVAVYVFSPTPQAFLANVGRSLAQLIPVLLMFWSIVTLTFAVLDYVNREHRTASTWNEWDPATLAPAAHSKKEKSRAGRIADLVVHCLWMLYVFAIPRHLYLVLGPGVLVLTELSANLAPIFRSFYAGIVVLLIAQLAIKVAALAPGTHRWEAPLQLLVKVFGVIPTALLAFSKVYFVPNGPAANSNTLAQINSWMNFGFRIALLIVVVSLLVDCWQYFRRFIPTQRLAF
jgi:hypothetical protein